jgi:hypothetical protein
MGIVELAGAEISVPSGQHTGTHENRASDVHLGESSLKKPENVAG